MKPRGKYISITAVSLLAAVILAVVLYRFLCPPPIPINNGFVFIEGQYIDAPYVVTRQGTARYINGVVAPAPIGETSKKKQAYDIDRVKEPPNLPATINAGSSFDDLISDQGDEPGMGWKIWAYNYGHFPGDIAKQNIIAWYKAAPCIMKVEDEPRLQYHIRLTHTDGSSILVNIGPPVRESADAPPSKVDHKADCERERIRFETCLKRGGALFLLPHGFIMSVDGHWIQDRLPKIITIVSSGNDREETIKSLAALEFPECYVPYMQDFRAFKQLLSRLAELQKK